MDYFEYYDDVKGINENRKKVLMEYAKRIDEMAKKQVVDVVEELTTIRQNKGMSQQDIADMTGMAASNVARVEGCKRTPTFQVLSKYANALGMELKIELTKKSEE